MSETTVARRFYAALAARDWQTAGDCYADDARFSDPVFPDLDAAAVRAMWRMLLTRGKDLQVDYEIRDESAQRASVHWIARYTFSQTGRRVVNAIDASLTLRDGRIVRHVDAFDFHRWASQALGSAGSLLGWLPAFRRKLQARAAAGLAQFNQRIAETGGKT